LKKLSLDKRALGYWVILAATTAFAVLVGYTRLAEQIDDYAYDWMFRLNPPAAGAPHCVILAIDEATYSSRGGVREIRSMLAKALQLIAPSQPKVVGIDVVLADRSDASEDDPLEKAMRDTKNLVLIAHLAEGRWEEPLDRFKRWAAAVGHDSADELSPDGVTRQISLEERTSTARHWALALEAFRLSRGERILESPQDLQIKDENIPAPRTPQSNRPLRILWTRDSAPQISLNDLIERPELAAQLTGKVVFIGITSITATYDRVVSPFREGRIPGVAVHAQLYETLDRGKFLTSPSDLTVLGSCLFTAVLAGLIFALLSGWPAYLSAAALLIATDVIPFYLFRLDVVFPFFSLLAAAWLTVAVAASYQHFIVRGALQTAETERKRYQQAIHFVTHEMRTPLTAIQGSSELMGRYNLSEEKRKQMAEMINQESKRLARMIQTFLDVERLSEGQMELKREPFSAREIVEACLQRVRPLGERKNIRIHVSGDLEGELEGDRELMEYAVYNLMNNAVKYSGSDTDITIACRAAGDRLRLSVQDQGIGMDAKEIKQIFQKFYRTKRAEASGEKGTGIGLSIVEEIVHHHGGSMEVTSQPGKGSCFTVVLPAYSRASRPPAVSV